MIARDLAINGLRSVASAEGLVSTASEGGKVKAALPRLLDAVLDELADLGLPATPVDGALPPTVWWERAAS